MWESAIQSDRLVVNSHDGDVIYGRALWNMHFPNFSHFVYNTTASSDVPDGSLSNRSISAPLHVHLLTRLCTSKLCWLQEYVFLLEFEPIQITMFFANTRDEYVYDSEEMVPCQLSVYLHQPRGRWSHIFTNNPTDDANWLSRWGDLMWLRLTEECTFPVPVWWLQLSFLVKTFPTEICVFVPALWGDIHTDFRKQYCTYS